MRLDSLKEIAYSVEHMPIPEFIKSLRAKIGADLLQVSTATVMAYDDRGRLLLVKDMTSGLWGPSSGIVEIRMSCWPTRPYGKRGRRRGVFVELTHVLGIFAGEHFSGVYPNGDQLSAVATVFAGRPISGTPRADHDETSDAKFFHPSEIGHLSCYPHFHKILSAVGHRPLRPYFKPATWCPRGPSGVLG